MTKTFVRYPNICKGELVYADKNIPTVKPAIVAVSRDCFPRTLSERRRRAVVDACNEKNISLFECSVTVETEKQADMALAEIKTAGCNALDIPLVLHGGSGLTDDDFRNTIAHGISKVNIYTDLCLAGVRGMQEGIEKGLSYLDIRNLKVQRIKEEVIKKMLVFGCQNRA